MRHAREAGGVAAETGPATTPSTGGGGVGRDLAGRTLGHYRVVEKLGQGGMGEVWVAEDLQLGRRVALKVLPPGDEAGERLARFEREARAVAALDHPNIVTLHSIEEADGIRFMTMALVGGRRLDQVIPEGGLDVDRALDLAAQIAGAVAAAHARGVVHRDLKPANVVLTVEGRPKVLDFGLAELRDDAPKEVRADTDTATATATRPSDVVGTVPYMSPEQLTGEPVGPASDVFSLGVVLHEMLVGRRPFDARTPAALMAAILRDDPPAPGTLRPGVPAELDAVVARCLAKAPEDRYADAGALHADLERLRLQWLSGTATPRPAIRRRGRQAAVVGVAAVVFAVVTAVGWRLADREATGDAATGAAPGTPTRIAVLPFDSLGAADDAYFAAGVAEEIRSRLTAVRGLGVISRASAAPYAGSDLALAEIGDRLGVDYLLDGTVRWDRTGGVDRVRVTPQLVRVDDDTQVWTATYDRVLEDIFGVQSEIAEAVIGQLDVALFPAERRAVAGERPTASLPAYQAYLRARDHLGRSVYDPSTYEQAIRELERAVEIDPGFAVAWAELSGAHSMTVHLGYDRTPERQEASRIALARALAVAPDAPEVRFARGLYRYRVERDYPGALEDLHAVLDRLPSAVDGLQTIGYVLRRQGDLEGAAEYLRRSLALSPGSGPLTVELATTLLFLRRYAEAERLYDQAILLDPNDANVYRSKALTTWLAGGDLARARTALEAMPDTGEAINVWHWFNQLLFEGDYAAARAAVAAGPPMLQGSFFAYPSTLLEAQAAELAGDADDARRLYAAAEATVREHLAATPDDARLHGALGLALAGLGRREEALAEARRGVELLPVAADAGTGPYRLFELAHVETQVGEHDAAVATLRTLLSIPARVSRRLVEIDPRFAPLRDHPGFRALPEA